MKTSELSKRLLRQPAFRQANLACSMIGYMSEPTVTIEMLREMVEKQIEYYEANPLDEQLNPKKD